MQDNGQGTTNILLLSLSEAVRNEVLAAAEVVHLDLTERIYDAGQPIQFVDFPEVGVMSVVRGNELQREIEIVTVGNEGMVGSAVLLDVPYVSQRAFCQVEGRSLRLPTDKFLQLLVKHPEFKTVCIRYIATMIDQMACNLLCNFSHDVEHRCARWLLHTHDRMHQNQFVITQEYLAVMLGCSRTGVNAACSKLADQGIIKYARGKMSVLDRDRLEKSSCGCYKAVTTYVSNVLKVTVAEVIGSKN